MSVIEYVLEFDAGASFSQDFQYLQADGVTPMPLTGLTARLQIRTSAYDTDPAPLVEAAPAITVGTGTISVALTPAQTRAAFTGTYWAMDLSNGDGSQVVPFARGRVKVAPEVVHD